MRGVSNKARLTTATLAVPLLSVLLSQAGVAAEWNIETVDPGQGGRGSVLVLDKTGNAHVAYVNPLLNQLKYAFWDHLRNKWFTMIVDKSVDSFASLAVDSHQRPHIACLDYGTGRLKYAHWDGASWTVRIIPLSSKRLEWYVSIAVDLADRPVITFYEINGTDASAYSLKLRSVAWTGSMWEIRTIDSTPGSGKFNYIVRNSDGRMSVAYANVKDENADLRYAFWDGKSWKPEILLRSDDKKYHVGSVAIALDKDDNPHIAFSAAATHEVKYATRRSGRWEFENADRLVQEGYPDRYGIAIDRDGNPYISAFDEGADVLKVLHRAAGKWISEEVDSGSCGFTSSIQLSEREVIVTYYDLVNNSLKCARRPLEAIEPALGDVAPSRAK
jgi:hypothetical protein